MKISELSAASALTGSELVAAVQSGVTVRTTTALLDGSGYYNVKRYGAVGDGVANDTAAIQAAVDAVEARGSGTVYFPNGTYLVTSTIGIDADAFAQRGMKVLGDTSLVSGGILGFSDNLFEVTGSGSGRVHFHNMWFYNTHNDGGCLDHRGTIGSSVVRCIFQGAFGLLATNSTAPFLVQNTKFHGSLSTWPNSIGMVADHHTIIDSCDFTGWDNALRTAGAQVSVIGSRFEINNTALTIGMDADGAAFIQAGGFYGGCTFEANETDIYVVSMQNVVIQASGCLGSANAPISSGHAGQSLYGIRIAGNAEHSRIEACTVGGTYATKAIEIHEATRVAISNVNVNNGFGGSSIDWDIHGGVALGTDLILSQTNYVEPTLVYTDLMTNGDFASSDVSTWYRGAQSVDGTLAVVAGQLVHTAGAAEAGHYPRWMFAVRNVVPGETYRLTVGAYSGTGGVDGRVLFGTDWDGDSSMVETNSAGSLDVTAIGPTLYIGSMIATATAGQTLVVDNLTVFLVPELTIASGIITVTKAYHRVDTQAAAASDDLDTINGGVDSDELVLRANNSARTVVVKDGTGNLKLEGDMSLDNEEDTIRLIYDGGLAKWLEVSRSNNGA